jgi:DNA repair photolyase
MLNDENPIKGRGAQLKSDNRFLSQSYCVEHEEGIDELPELDKPTSYLEIFPKSIVNRVDSPDLPMQWSMNPYQGCEHGCIYCYARNSHMYWGYESGLDFESKILVKQQAAELLRSTFMKKSWKAEPIMLSGNTDCYQPIERKLKITREVLKVFAQFKNPVGIITKNYLISRDIDILQELAKEQLIHANITITSLDEDLRRKMEPRTSTAKMRLKAIEMLASAGIPVAVMIAPVIPGLNSPEIPEIVKAAADAGASKVRHTFVRLNGSIGEIFKDWLSKTYPGRAKKVLNQIASAHGGKLNDSDFGRRMRGEGNISNMITQMIRKSESRYMAGREILPYNLNAFQRPGETMTIPGL